MNGIPAEKLPEMPAGGYINGQRPKETGSSISSSEGGKSKRKHDPFYVTGTSSENLLAYGMLPESRLIDQEKCKRLWCVRLKIGIGPEDPGVGITPHWQ